MPPGKNNIETTPREVSETGQKSNGGPETTALHRSFYNADKASSQSSLTKQLENTQALDATKLAKPEHSNAHDAPKETLEESDVPIKSTKENEEDEETPDITPQKQPEENEETPDPDTTEKNKDLVDKKEKELADKEKKLMDNFSRGQIIQGTVQQMSGAVDKIAGDAVDG